MYMLEENSEKSGLNQERGEVKLRFKLLIYSKQKDSVSLLSARTVLVDLLTIQLIYFCLLTIQC